MEHEIHRESCKRSILSKHCLQGFQDPNPGIPDHQRNMKFPLHDYIQMELLLGTSRLRNWITEIQRQPRTDASLKCQVIREEGVSI